MKTIQIIKSTTKIKDSKDILINLDAIIEILKEDVLLISKIKRKYFADFDFTFEESVKILKTQLKKTHLRGIKNFLMERDIEICIRFLFSRILNTMVNISTNKKYKLYCSPQLVHLNNNIKLDCCHEKDIEILDLYKFDKETIKLGLKKVYKDEIVDRDFDFEDFKGLAEAFGFTPIDILIYDPYIVPKMSSEACNNSSYQLLLVFDDREII